LWESEKKETRKRITEEKEKMRPNLGTYKTDGLFLQFRARMLFRA
jgi:hypothetical protein